MEIEVVVGPVPWPSARAWLASARRVIAALRTDATPVVPWDVVDLFERYVGMWEQLPTTRHFHWHYDVPLDDVEAMAVHWIRLMRVRHHLTGDGAEARAALRFEAALAAGYDRAFATAATESHPLLARLAAEPRHSHPTSSVTRLLLVDPDRPRRGVVRVWLERQGDLDIVADVGDGHDAVRLARKLRPDVVVLDLDVPGIDGIATTSLLRENASCAVVVFSSGQRGPEALGAGADAYIDRDASPGRLVGEIRRVASTYAAAADLIVVLTHALGAPLERITSAAKSLRTAVLEGRDAELHEAALDEIRTQVHLAMGILTDVVRGGAATATALADPRPEAPRR